MTTPGLAASPPAGLPGILATSFPGLEAFIRREARLRSPRPPWEPQDLVQAGWVGALQAARHFDVARGVPFLFFARQRIRGAMLDELHSGSVRAVSTGILERFDREDPGAWQPDAVQIDVAHALGRLSPGERRLVAALCIAGVPLSRAATAWQRPGGEVRREYWAALRTLREALDGYGPAKARQARPASANPLR